MAAQTTILVVGQRHVLRTSNGEYEVGCTSCGRPFYRYLTKAAACDAATRNSAKACPSCKH